jgi:hypothetical protein
VDLAPDAVEPANAVAERKLRPLRRHGAAAATKDRFMDAVVLISVLLFLILAAGVGVLVLRSTGLFGHLPFHVPLSR